MARELVIRRRLRRGGTSEILEAEETQDGGVRRVVVLKRLLPELSAECGAAFLDEARLLAQLVHPGVVRLLGTDRFEGELVQILEPIDGRTMREWCELGVASGLPLPRSAALHVLSALADALAHVHEAKDLDGQPLGIVHRDLSPSNVMLSRRGELKLIDFGVARAHRREASTRVGLVKGTPGFMAPEQHRGQAVDQRTDLYALGLFAWFLLEGRSPMEEPRAWEQALSGGRVHPPERWPEALRQLVAGLLEPDPRARPRSAAAVRQRLLDLVDSAPGGAAALAEWIASLDRVRAPTRGPEVKATHPLAAMFAFGAGESEASVGGTQRVFGPGAEESTVGRTEEPTQVEWTSEASTTDSGSEFAEQTRTSPTDPGVGFPATARSAPPVASVAPRSEPPLPLSFTPSVEVRPALEERSLMELPLSVVVRTPRVWIVASLAALLVIGVLIGRWWSSPARSEGAPAIAAPVRVTPELRAVPAPSPEVEASPLAPLGAAEREVDDGEPASARPRTVRRKPALAPTAPAEPEPRRSLDPEAPVGSRAELGDSTEALRELSRELRTARLELPPAELQRFERRYFDLRAELGQERDAAADRRLVERVQEVRAALAASRSKR